MIKEFGIKEPVSSPTFSIINEYKSGSVEIYHIDLYRLKDARKPLLLGLKPVLYPEIFVL
jgi:tRNA threonylcarbamoyladenosine biosynthesis protein TsaE